MGITILGIENFVVIPLLIFIGILLFFIYNRKLFRYMINKISKRKFFSKYSDNLPEAYDILQNSVTPKIASVCISLSFLYWLIISISAYVVLLAFNITTIDIVQTVAIYTTSVIIGAIMFIPGGLGVTEGSLAGLLSLSGIEFSLSLVIAIVIRLFTLWYPVSIGFVALKLSGGLSINENPEKS